MRIIFEATIFAFLVGVFYAILYILIIKKNGKQENLDSGGKPSDRADTPSDIKPDGNNRGG
jgi:hypothetical protein